MILLIGNGGADGVSESGKSVLKKPSVKFSVIKKPAPHSNAKMPEDEAKNSAVTEEKGAQDAQPNNVLQSLFQQYGSDEDD